MRGVDVPNPVVAEELDLLAKVSALLSDLPVVRTASEEPIVRELERLRAVILSGDEAKDISALSEQYHHQSAVLSQLRSAGASTAVDPGCPYFAHLRLRENGGDRDLCLGRATCIEGGMRIVDWRDAPISKIFYGYRQGDEYDEEISGRERIGEVLARRMVRIRGGVLERVQAPEGDFRLDPDAPEGWRQIVAPAPRLAGGQGTALRAFGPDEGSTRRLGTDLRESDSSDPSGADLVGEPMRADKHLPEITALIDPSQFELITHTAPGFLVIRGVAGSGKTTVALHRVAYLAFDDPAIDGPETMVVVFSRALQNFVGHVLPSLGLQHVRIVTYHDWVHEERRRHFPQLPTEQREDTPASIQRIKLHPLCGVALQLYTARTLGEPTAARALDDWATVMRDADLLGEACLRSAPDAFSKDELQRFADWHRVQLEDVFARMAGDEDAQAELDPEDDALLLRAWQLRVGPLLGPGRKPIRMRHLVIDEVQDFSPLEVQVLLDCMEPDATITLAGDTQQHLVQSSGFTSWPEFFQHLGIAGHEIETLRVSYRSSRPIVEFSRAVLGHLLEDAEAPEIPREGPPVELFRFTDRGGCVAFLADALRDLSREEPRASVAILAPTAAISDVYFSGLERCELPRLRRVRDQDFSFTAGVEITEIDQVKGLEFDYVILVDVDAAQFPDLASARRLLHVGASRAIHQLWLTSVATPSPLVARYWND
jgi:DNA helicase-2/ATP-dependent DNA helicase PcrA